MRMSYADTMSRSGKEQKMITITEQLEEIKEQVCTQLCKWPNIWDEEEEGMELVDSEHCKECPLNRL